jgi:hypothetical protein
MKGKVFNYGGIAAAIVLIAFGIGAVVMGVNGRDTVRSNLAAEKIAGTPDMTPSAIKAEAQAAKLDTSKISFPTKSVAGQDVNTGARARTFAQYMRIHALEATGGQVYAEMGRYLDKAGKPTNDQNAAAVDPKTGKPVENGARNIWINETALSTALNTSYFAENVATFAIVMGVALLLTGIGFLVLSLGLVRVPLGKREEAEKPAPATKAVPAIS